MPIKNAQGGFSLIEIMVSMSVVSIGALMSMSLMVSSISLDVNNRQTNAETADVRAVVENVEGMDFEDLWTSFNADPNDDPDGVGTASGPDQDWFRDLPAAAALGGGTANSHNPFAGDTAQGTPGSSSHGTAAAAKTSLRSAQMTPGRKLAIGVQLPLDADGDLSEQSSAELFGADVDINADGIIDGASRVTDYKVVPMIINLEIDGAKGRKKKIRIPRIRMERKDG